MGHAALNEMINFLEQSAPDALNELREKYSDTPGLLIADMQGVSKIAVKKEAQAVVDILLKSEPLVRTLSTMVSERLAAASQDENLAMKTSMVVAGLTTIVTAIGAQIPKFSIYALWIACLGAIGTIFVNWKNQSAKAKRRSITGEDLLTHARFLNDAATNITELSRKIATYTEDDDPEDYTQEVEKLVERGNDLHRMINRINNELRVAGHVQTA
jgi:hypothetical protein